jgi:hypothetical protein
VPIWLFVVFQVAQDAFAFLGRRDTGTAVTVHLAGAAFAFAYYKMHWRLLRLVPNVRDWRAHQRRPKLRVLRPDDEPVAVGAQPAARSEDFEAKVDAVLEKVARSGQESLTDGERQILLRASELYKRRRS